MHVITGCGDGPILAMLVWLVITSRKKGCCVSIIPIVAKLKYLVH